MTLHTNGAPDGRDPFEENGFRGALVLLADAVPEPEVTDLVAAQAAWARAHRPARPVRAARGLRAELRLLVREHPLLVAPVATAAALAVVLAALVVLPGMHLSAPAPAKAPSGPGALPDKLYVAPPWTPWVTDRPISRAAYLLSTGQESLVVGADGGEYRRLPDLGEHTVLSGDGRRVAYVLPRNRTGGDGVTPNAEQSRVRVLDLPTGRAHDVTLTGVFAADTSVDGMALDAAGSRLAVWGGDGWDETMHSARSWVLDIDGGGVPRVVSACGCSGTLAWLADGRLAYDDGVGAGPAWTGVETVRLPAEPLADTGTARLTGIGPAAVVAPDGRTRYAVTSQDPQSVGSVEAFTLLASGFSGEPRRTDLGRAREIAPLAALPDGVVTVRWSESVGATGDVRSDGPDTVEITTTSGRRTLTTGENGLVVAQVASAVAAGGKVVPGVRPEFGPSTLGWWGWHVRPWLIGLVGLVGLLGLVLVVVLVEQAARRSVLPRGWQALRVLPRRVGRRNLVRMLAGAMLVAGLAWSLAPDVIEAVETARQRRATPEAPALLPRAIGDQRLRLPRAFDNAGHPRTVRLTEAFVTTVAGRPGLYGVDAGTAGLVRLDDLPGLPDEVRGGGPRAQAVALSPSGRWLALWTDGVVGHRVALVDLASARVSVRSDVTYDEGGSATGTAWSPMGIDDEGTLWVAGAFGASGRTLGRFPLGEPGVPVPKPRDVSAVSVQAGGSVVVQTIGGEGAQQYGVAVVDLRGTQVLVPQTPLFGERIAVRSGGFVFGATTTEGLLDKVALRDMDAVGGAPAPGSGTEGTTGIAASRVLALSGGTGTQMAGALRTDGGWYLVRGAENGTPLDESDVPPTAFRLPVEGRVVVASGALSRVFGQIRFGGVHEAWWVRTFGHRPDPVGRGLILLLTVLPVAVLAAGRYRGRLRGGR